MDIKTIDLLKQTNLLIRLRLIYVYSTDDWNKLNIKKGEKINIMKRFCSTCKNKVINKISYLIVIANDYALLKGNRNYLRRNDYVQPKN